MKTPSVRTYFAGIVVFYFERESMNVSDYLEEYIHKSDDELLCLWAESSELVPDAVMALESEVERRRLDKTKAVGVKKRFDRLRDRELQGSLADQVAAAKYERNMRHFDPWKEPEFNSRYNSRDIRNTFAFIRHKYRVWKSFRDHTGQWPTLSIAYFFLSWIPVCVLFFSLMSWIEQRDWQEGWKGAAMISLFLALLGLRELGARLMRNLDANISTKQPEIRNS